jgi:hypothetical protein
MPPSSFIDIKYFILSFSIGMFFTYIFIPTPEVIIQFPNPMNSGKVQYKDATDTCYVYESKEVPCTNDAVENSIQNVGMSYTNKKKKNTSILDKLWKRK